MAEPHGQNVVMLPTIMTSMRLATLVALSGAVWVGGCGPSTDGEAGSDDGPAGAETVAVALAVDHRARWRELRIEGTTDLPDGAVVTYQVTHALASELPPSEWPAQNLIADGTAVVQAGAYWAQLNTTYWPPGTVEVEVQFPIAPQPDTVRARYGEFGEQLAGDNVTSLGAFKVVTAEHTFDWTR